MKRPEAAATTADKERCAAAAAAQVAAVQAALRTANHKLPIVPVTVGAAEVLVGLGPMVAIYHRSSTAYQIH